ncbi:hypothetical protein O6H91_06G115600 [Diphasiastrum complanatum]|uniref:Uncharacterized protein n=2 Tax=Diphasiastrum complanatum TaxID=34168 RepID=A0ACC2DHS5_DIPCM|nr:hypothetical protein O6H91_06G115600 [Diphasiastrum complanatum]KAJ7553856.1 hypothetical protein O6H91_06G115600 [Diphasiastrum complanatum]
MAIALLPRSCLADAARSLPYKQPQPQPPQLLAARQFRSLKLCRIQFNPVSVSGRICHSCSNLLLPLHCSQAESSQAASETEQIHAERATFSAFEEFVDLNAGKWSGTFTQYDAMGNELACIPTRMTAFSYGKEEQSSLCQTLFVRKARSKTSVSDDMDDFEWTELKLDEINIATFENRQTTYFPGERAYSISHRTTEMLNTLLRSGLLGDDDEEEEIPKGVKLASRRPALVSESCLYSQRGNIRARAFHVVDQRGLTDLFGVFRERKDCDSSLSWSGTQNEDPNRLSAILGKWSGEAIFRRTGIYGSTIAKGQVQVIYEELENGRLRQEISSDKVKSTKLDMNGTVAGNVLTFSGGLQTTLLPEGMAMTSPISVGRSVGNAQSFFLEFSWILPSESRRRLVRTYDVDGVVVSTTLATETRS